MKRYILVLIFLTLLINACITDGDFGVLQVAPEKIVCEDTSRVIDTVMVKLIKERVCHGDDHTLEFKNPLE